MTEKRFKVGDLVRIHGMTNISFYTSIENGSCGVVTEVLPEYLHDKPFDESFFFDYKVLVKGQIYFMFDDEMTEYREEDDPCESCECTPCDCDWGIE